ncbi:MAG: helix-turn-helix domain-containing protein [Hyphomicrobiales bacterium]
MDYLLNGPLRSLEIGVEAHLVEELGWHVNGEPVRSVIEGRLNQLTAVCWSASLALSSGFRSAPLDDKRTLKSYWRERVLTALEPVLEPWLAGSRPAYSIESSRSAQHNIVRSAASFFEACRADDGFEADRLAATLGISRRTLFRAFRTTLGIGPRRFFELKRLHALRSRLKCCSPDETTVTACAHAEGFAELGRLSGIYRKHFGENPSDTLKKHFQL